MKPMQQTTELQPIVEQIVFNCIAETNAQNLSRIEISQGIAAPILAGGRYIESLGLVSLLVAIEQELEIELEHTLDLAAGITQANNEGKKPLATVRTLVAYIVAQLSQ